MAVKIALVLLLWGLMFFVPGETSFCNVTCSTDYNVTLNCSCSAPVPTYSVFIQVNCSDYGLEASGSCEVKPPQSWCVMYPEDFEDVISIGTMCTATATRRDGRAAMDVTESSEWELSRVVKPEPPFNTRVVDSDGFYNITWDHSNMEDCLTYRVRVRESSDLSKAIVLRNSVEEKHLLLEHKMLQPYRNYTVDVGVKMCPENLYRGPWSEWGSSAEWRTAGGLADAEGLLGWWWYTSLSIVAVFGVLLGVYSQKTFFKEKFQLVTFIPTPDNFFKSLYHDYEGNFREWVKPVFTEYDFLNVSSPVHMSEKQLDVLQLNDEKQSYSEDVDMEEGDQFLHTEPPHSNSLLFFLDSGSSGGTGHSTGHISIHTVTLSGEEEFEEDSVSRGSVNRSYPDSESLGSFMDDNSGQPDYDLEEPQRPSLERLIRMFPEQENRISIDLSVGSLNFQPHAELNEPERVSLGSFGSNEHSEDGYPHVDLDTIDSGFGECSSPGASDSHTQQMDLFQEHKNSNSNYVKQWMICSTIREDSGNVENELHETQ